MTDEEGKVTLHDCVKNEDVDLLTRLLDNGSPVDERDEYGWTPLCRGAWLGHAEIVKVLISRGADVNAKDRYGWTPLCRGAWLGHAEIVKVLISRGADVNAKDKYGWTPLHRSTGSVHTHTGTAKLLIQHGADVNVKEMNGKTPLHYSAGSGDTEIVNQLIQHRADINVRSNGGETPLHCSATSGHNEIVKLLIQHGADIDPLDVFRCTPLMYAKNFGHRDTVDILRQAKPKQAGDGRRMGVFGLYSRYSSHTRNFSIQKSHGGGLITKFKYENKEVRAHDVVTGAVGVSTSETGKEAKGDKVKVMTQDSQGDKNREGVTKSAETSSYLTTSEVDACTSPALSSTLATPEQPSASSSSPPTAPPSTSLAQLPQTPPPPLASPLTSPPPEPRDEVTEYAQKLLKAVKSKKKTDQDPLSLLSEQLGASVVVVEQKTENHYHNTYNNTYHNTYNNSHQNCDHNNKQTTSEEVKVENSETLDGSVGSTKYGVLHPPQGDTYEKRGEDEHICRPGGEEEERKNKQTLDVDVTDVPKSELASSSSLTASEIRRRLERQAGYMEKMVQSCVAGGGVCQDQSSDLVPLHHGGLHVPVNFNIIMQPKHVEVNSAKQVTCEKVDIESAEVVASQSTCNFNYAPRPSSDAEDNEDNSDDNNSEGEKKIQIENNSDSE